MFANDGKARDSSWLKDTFAVDLNAGLHGVSTGTWLPEGITEDFEGDCCHFDIAAKKLSTVIMGH